jgi:hypothetical protein
MSIRKIEQELQSIKKDFSALEPDKASKNGPPEKKGSRSMALVGVVAVIVVIIVVLVLILF